MTPGYLLLFLGGHLLMLTAFMWLLFRLGGFTASRRERRSWLVMAAALVPWVVLLAFIGPLPMPLVIAMNVLVVVLFLWAWRTGKFRLESVPADSREEAERRRRWMREHVGLITGLFIGFTVVNLVWAFVVILIASAAG